MQEKRIKSLKLTDPLTIWSRGRRGRDVGTSGNRRCRAAPRKLRAGRGLSPGFGLPWEASGGDRQGMLTPTACPSGLPPAASCTQGCGTTAQSKRRLATGNWGGRHLRGPRERGEPSLCTDPSSGHQGGQGPDAQLRVPMSSPSYPSKLSSQSPTALNHVLPHGATPASLHPTFLLAGPLTFPHTPTSCLPNTSPSSKALPKHQLPPTVFPGHYLHQPSP